jgi:hypothetical protein
MNRMAAKKGIKVNREQLLYWYNEERKSLRDIALLLGIDYRSLIYWMKKFDISRRCLSEALTKTWRADFSGNLDEKAYLIGFRLGDLHVSKTKPGNSATIRVLCASSKFEQIELIRQLFEPYGYVKITPMINGLTNISCYLNMTFDFLLPKQDKIEEWIVSDKKFGIAFFAGYIDAEGCFGIDSNGSGNLKVESYDVGILFQLYEILKQLDVICPPPNLIKKKDSAKQKLNKDLWRLGVYRKTSIDRLCFLLEPYLRHTKRRQDMMITWQNVRDRIARGRLVITDKTLITKE